MAPASSEAADVPCTTRYDAVAVVAMVLISAAPMELPVCCVAFTSALATPASSGLTPISAVLDMATNAMPMPMLTMISAGSTTDSTSSARRAC